MNKYILNETLIWLAKILDGQVNLPRTLKYLANICCLEKKLRIGILGTGKMGVCFYQAF
jgi:hypothetical protein